jgi:ribulose-5-phosphate 4-epimerase/fuculose-1-phosphate aldolase
MVHAVRAEKDEVSEQIWRARVDLSSALKIAVRCGLNEGIDNHFTLMVPGRNDRFFLSPYGLHWSEVEPQTLMIVDDQGKRVEGEGFVDPSAYLIHWPIHRARPDAQCVMHTHMPYASALASLKEGRLVMCHQNSLRFFGKVAYDDAYDGLVFDAAQGDSIAQALGNAAVLFLAHHGVIVVGRTVGEAFHRLYFLERACMVQFIAMSSGRPLASVPDAEAENAVRQFDEWDEAAAQSHFEALKRRLTKDSSSNW